MLTTHYLEEAETVCDRVGILGIIDEARRLTATGQVRLQNPGPRP